MESPLARQAYMCLTLLFYSPILTTAPAAADTLLRHLADTGRKAQDYDLIISGDLGCIGSALMKELCKKQGVELDNYKDCGCEIFSPEQDTHAGGSGCGCAAVSLNGWLLGELSRGSLNRILFMGTGALLSPTSAFQGETVPGVAHAVVLEGGKG